MKKKLIQKYMFVFTISTLTIVLMWGILTYVFVISGNEPDGKSPQYLVNTFEQYVNFENDIVIDKDGKEILRKNGLWAQVVDGYGKVQYAYNSPAEAKEEYNIFEVGNYVLNSNVLGENTIFVREFSEHTGYGIIIGCDSSKVSKVTFKLTGGVWKTAGESALILCVIFILAGIGAGFLFSQSIAMPVDEIIADINNLEMGNEIEEKQSSKIFQPVFESLGRLKLRLNSVERERKRIENQRKEWIINISHDMKTPLSSIRGYAELMENNDYSVSIDEMHQYAQVIMRNADVIKDLTDELKFSKLLENGEIQLQKEEVNICGLLKQCCEEIPAAYDAGSIQYEFEEEQIYVSLDKELMRRCFVNIICNAIVHNSCHVDVVIRCKKRDRVFIEIKDNGCGMNETERENIFNRYYRGKTSAGTEGSGLGLAIAKEIIEVHGGAICVESEEGKGSTFFISI
ncbi:MAG: HAMP domain-containing histidine kinase [Clostridiaceae bacterium]|nr:HAMP domain-containing histidine kinase [Clostridiaceae bacterium]